jgi:hypothetical protein
MLEMLADVGVQRCYGIVGDVPETIAIAVNADRGALRHSGLSCFVVGISKVWRRGWESTH